MAVLVSPGYGAGWSTWADNKEAAVFAPDVVAWVESGLSQEEYLKNESAWNERFGYLGGMDQLTIEWVPRGSRFDIDEYDGSETLTIFGPDWGFLA